MVGVLLGSHRGRHHAVLEQSADVRLHLTEHPSLVQLMVLRVCNGSEVTKHPALVQPLQVMVLRVCNGSQVTKHPALVQVMVLQAL